LESAEVTSEEDADMHVSGGSYDSGKEHQIESVRFKRNFWKGLANTKYSQEIMRLFEDLPLSRTRDTIRAIRYTV